MFPARCHSLELPCRGFIGPRRVRLDYSRMTDILSSEWMCLGWMRVGGEGGRGKGERGQEGKGGRG